MKLFKFSLTKVLEYKEMVQNIESNILKEMKDNHNRLLRELDALVEQYQKGKEELIRKSRQGATVSELKAEGEYLSYLQEQINLKQLEIRKSEQSIEIQIAKLTKVKTEKASIERLKEKEFKDYKFLEQKENEVYIDEFVSNASLRPTY